PVIKAIGRRDAAPLQPVPDLADLDHSTDRSEGLRGAPRLVTDLQRPPDPPAVAHLHGEHDLSLRPQGALPPLTCACQRMAAPRFGQPPALPPLYPRSGRRDVRAGG